MSPRAALAGLCLAWQLSPFSAPATRAETKSVSPTYRELQFSQSAPYSTKAEITRRFGYPEPFPEVELALEKFHMLVPPSYSTNFDSGGNTSVHSNASWGLLVWVSPGDSPGLPPDWAPELARHRLLLVSAAKSGNERHLVDRFRLALDGTFNACRLHKIDRKRIYIGGMSGGGRVASMLGVACADLFTGTLSVCGANYYRDITDAVGRKYPATFLPDARVLPLAKKSSRFVLLTGEFDPNRENTMATHEKGFQRDGFKHVFYLEVPEMKHALPGATVLGKALDYLDGDPNLPTNSDAKP